MIKYKVFCVKCGGRINDPEYMTLSTGPQHIICPPAIEYITIEERLLAEAALTLVPWLAPAMPPYTHHSTAEVRRSLVEELAVAIEDSEPFCDHAVGICACSPRGVLEDLRQALAGSLRCRTCGGDGYLPIFTDAVPEGSGDGPWGDWAVEPTPGACPMCQGSGWVKI